MIFDEREVSRRLGGVTCRYFDEISSTNAELVDAVKNGTAKCGDIVAAGRQSAGRGRRGHTFSSRDGGIYFSFAAENKAGDVNTVAAGTAVADALEKFGFSPEIKWVNDVLLGGKKVCGILAEAVSGTDVCVVGIGINLLSSAIPEELTDIAASLEEHGEAPRADVLVADVICRYRELCSMDRAEVIARYKSYMRLLGGKITVKQTGEELTAHDVTNAGELVAKRRDGSTVILNSGEISICK